MTTTAAPETEVIAGARGARGLIDLAYRIREFGIVAALAILIIVTVAIQPRFFSSQELTFILQNTAVFWRMNVSSWLLKKRGWMLTVTMIRIASAATMPNSRIR